MRKLIFIIFSLFFLLTTGVSAQFTGGSFEINLSPETPAPFEDMVASIDSFVFDINQANITWLLDGKEALRGIGERILKFKAKDIGEIITLDVIVSARGSQSAKRAIIIPASIDLLVEAVDVYTPPFYRGRSLPTSESQIKVVAVPNVLSSGRKIPLNQLSYEWSRNGNVDLSGFGFKKSFFVFKNTMFSKKENVSVAVRGQTSELGRGGISFEITEPKILFYEEGDEGVLYQRALQNLTLTKETPIAVEPYFFSPKNLADSALQFVWKINENEVLTPKKNRLILRPDKAGTVMIGVEIKNDDKLLLSDSKNLPVIIK